MQYLLLVATLILSISTVQAQYLCTPDCELTVTFPSGGIIEAIETTTLSFGDNGELRTGLGGTINTAIPPSNLDFSQGGLLELVAGESINFGNDGYLSLGTAGNIIGNQFNLSTTGDFTISAISDDASIDINGELSISGTLQITASNITIESNIEASTGILSNGSAPGSLTLNGAGTLTVSPSGTLTVNNVVLPVITGPTISEIATNSVGVITIEPSTPIVITGPDTVTPLQDLSLFEGIELVTADGNACVVTGNECITSDGTHYVLVEGNLVTKIEAEAETETETETETEAEKKGAGGLDFYLLFWLFLSPFASRYIHGLRAD